MQNLVGYPMLLQHLMRFSPILVFTAVILSLTFDGVLSQSKPENNSIGIMPEPEGFSYWSSGTEFPCAHVDQCTFIVNGTDPLGGDDSQASPENEYEHPGPCEASGRLDISKNWYGYLGEFRLRANGAKFYYKIHYPEQRCCIKLILYMEEQTNFLRARMNCIQKQSVVDPLGPQVITLSPSQPSSGCTSNVTQNGERQIHCHGGRIIKSDKVRQWYIAISSCGSPNGILLDFTLAVYGQMGACNYSSSSGVRGLHNRLLTMWGAHLELSFDFSGFALFPSNRLFALFILTMTSWCLKEFS